MEKLFKKLKGNRVYLIYPKEQKSDIIMTPDAKKAVTEERIQQMFRLKVYAVGENVTDISEGDEVMVDLSVLLRKPPIIPLSEDVDIICVSCLDIAHIW